MIYKLPPSTFISRGSKQRSRFATLTKFPSFPFLPSVGTVWMSLLLASLRGFTSPQAAARPPRRYPLARLPASPPSSFSSASAPPCPPLASPSPAAGSLSSSFHFSPSGGRICIPSPPQPLLLAMAHQIDPWCSRSGTLPHRSWTPSAPSTASLARLSATDPVHPSKTAGIAKAGADDGGPPIVVFVAPATFLRLTQKANHYMCTGVAEIAEYSETYVYCVNHVASLLQNKTVKMLY
jgi:hypothetical protein